MKNILLTVVIACMSFRAALGVDNNEQVEKVLQTYVDAVDKAEQARLKTVDKAADSAISQLTKLATKARTEKDQASESRAWKSVLKLDDTHEKARKYFTDMDTLEKTLKEVAEEAKLVSKSPRLFGKWSTLFNDRTIIGLTINPNGTVVRAVQNRNPQTYPLAVEGNSLILRMKDADTIERWTLVGSKIFVEQWYPSSLYDEGKEDPYFGYATKDE